MGKHGKRVSVDKSMNFDTNVDVFSSPELLNEYLDSLGIGHAPAPVPTVTERREISDRLFGGESQDEDDYEDSEDAGAVIADMLMQKMGGSPRPRREQHREQKTVTTTTTAVVTETKTEIPSASANVTKKSHSNVCIVRSVNGVKHISIRDFAGNATSAVVRSGEMYVKPEDIDRVLRLIYQYRKITGMPAAVYDEDEFVDRMLMKGIYDVDQGRYIFVKSENFEDVILAYIIDEVEEDQFIKYVKGSLTEEEIPDTVLALLSMMSSTSVLTGDLGMANWYLATYSDQNSLKDSLESDILEHVEQNQDDTSVHIDFDDFDYILNNLFANIARSVESLEDAKQRQAEEIMPGKTAKDFEKFDPYKSQVPSTEVEEGKDRGASSDVKTFPGENDESESRRVSGYNSQTGDKLHNVREGSEGANPNISNNSQYINSEEEKEEETGVRIDRGNWGSSELEEPQKEKVQTGNGNPEITEVDPDNFKFEEEKEEKTSRSMVVDRIICSKK